MIKLRGLKKGFNNKQVLRGVDLHVRKGESMVVIGGSGSGKSVLMKHTIGLLQADEGTVEVAGKDITRAREKELVEIRCKFGMLFQGAALFDSLTVGENVGFFLANHTKMPKKQREEVAEAKLRMVGLPGIAHLKPAELSGGMKKRVGLARAIASEPEIMLYDEPTTGLDPIMADMINELIVSLNKGLKVTSLSITHDMASAYKTADRIAMLYKGEILEVGTPHEIQESENPIIQQFIHGRAEGPITQDYDQLEHSMFRQNLT
ncbi:MAG: ABC transporter ATP-binding protein [bacterium]